MNDTIPSHHIIVYLCRCPSWWRHLSHARGKSAWRIMGCILKVASTIVVFESSIHFFLKDAEDESNYEHWNRQPEAPMQSGEAESCA